MKQTVTHETLGEITYEEGFWLGRKSVYVNGNQLEKTSKNTFKLTDSENLTLKGNFLHRRKQRQNAGKFRQMGKLGDVREITTAKQTLTKNKNCFASRFGNSCCKWRQ